MNGTQYPLLSAGDSRAHLLDHHPHLNYVRTLGEGSFGFVYEVLDNRHAPPVRRAVKFIRRGPQTVTAYVESEILNHWKLRHPNIVQLIEICVIPDYLCILLELAPGGNLWDRILSQGRLNETRARDYFQQLILAVDYCHGHGVVNRDIKPNHLCLCGDRGEILKLCDFGLSKCEVSDSVSKSRVGTPFFMSPEVLMAFDGRPYDGKLADVWSCGVTLYYMTTGEFPFVSLESLEERKVTNTFIVRQTLEGEYRRPDGLSSELEDLLEKMLVKDPGDRIGIDVIKRHPWFLENLPAETADRTGDFMRRDGGIEQSLESMAECLRRAKRKRRCFSDVPP